MSGYDSLVLDHDGVIIDILDEERRRRAFHERIGRALPRTGGVPTADLVDRLAFSVSHADLHALSERLDADPEAVWQARDDTLVDVLQAAVREGEKSLYPDVDALDSVDIPLGIASNNQRRLVEFVLETHGMADQFGTIQARQPRPESLQHKKPSPTFLTAAREKLGASNSLYVGDKETDVRAGRRAGMDVAFLRRSHNADRSLDVTPTYDVSGLDDVVSLLE